MAIEVEFVRDDTSGAYKPRGFALPNLFEYLLEPVLADSKQPEAIQQSLVRINDEVRETMVALRPALVRMANAAAASIERLASGKPSAEAPLPVTTSPAQ